MPRILRVKVDWAKAIRPLKEANFQTPEVIYLIKTLRLHLKQVGETAIYRDEQRHIALHITKKYVAVEFEGMFFKTDEDFQFVRDFFKGQNDKYSIAKPWRVSRLDLAIDFLGVQPVDILPISNPAMTASFKHKIHSIGDGDTKEIQTIYLKNYHFDVRVYRKDLEIKSKKGRPKGIYNLREYKEEVVSRLEVELAGEKKLEFPNQLLNSDLLLSEREFVQHCLHNFAERSNVRLRTEAKNPKYWPLIWAWKVFHVGTLPENMPSITFQKINQRQDILMKLIKQTVNRAEKEGITEDTILEAFEVALQQRKRSAS